MYFILDRLEEAGYVESREEAPPSGYGGKLRHIFTTTALGQEVLKYEEQFALLTNPQTATSIMVLS